MLPLKNKSKHKEHSCVLLLFISNMTSAHNLEVVEPRAFGNSHTSLSLGDTRNSPISHKTLKVCFVSVILNLEGKPSNALHGRAQI